MSEYRNTFNQGLDQDSSKNKYDNTHYFDAQNIRVLTQEGLSSGAIENILGNVKRLSTVVTSSGNSHAVVGYTILRDYIILFTTINSSSSSIWKVPISSIESLSSSFLELDEDYFHLGGHLIYTGDLDFSKSNKIKAIPRYENENVQKVYWIDNSNNLRHINTVYNADTNDLVNMSIDKLEVISNLDVTRPEIVGTDSGNLRSGKIQYVYQLYNLNGSETVFSPTSTPFNITEYDESSSDSSSYKGSALDINTGKAIRGLITLETQGYSRIRIVAIHYSTLEGDPEIRIVEEKDISPTDEKIYFLDTGQNLGTYLLEEIRILGTYLFSAKEIAVKDNILFPANITEKSFDIDFDARTYRFGGASSTSTDPNYNQYSTRRRVCRIYDSQGNYYSGYGTSPTGTWYYTSFNGVPDSSKNVTGWQNIPEDFDNINYFNDSDNDGNHSYRFMYQTNGITLGGEGPNIKYTFKVKTVELDDNSGITNIKTGTEGSTVNPSFNNYASPYQCAEYLGYARDEVYRFGIVFFDEKGRSSFVKWIGDIRMPSVNTIGNIDNYDSSGDVNTPQITRITTSDSEIDPLEPIELQHVRYTVQYDNDPFLIGNSYSLNSTYNVDDSASAISYGSLQTTLDITSTTSSGSGVAYIDITFVKGGTHTITVKKWIFNGTDWEIVAGWTPDSIINTQEYIAEVTTRRDFNTVFLDTNDSKVKMNILYPEFTIDLTGTEAEGLSYQIVRVKRESADRSIRAQGLVSGTYVDSDSRYPYTFAESTNWSTDLICLSSPEIAFNKNLTRRSDDKISIIGTFSDYQTLNENSIYKYKYKSITPLDNPQTPAGSAIVGDEFYSNNYSDVDAGKVVGMEDSEDLIGTLNYHTQLKSTAGAELNSDRGINFVLDLNNSSWAGLNKAVATRHLVNYKRNVFNEQYGGYTYESRGRNQYIPTGKVQKQDEAVISVFGGDTYISMFDYWYSGWKIDESSGFSTVIIFPIETSINLDLRLDECYHTQKDTVSDTLLRLMRERQGIYTDGTNTHTQPTDLYIYNSVYSKENTGKIYISKPFDWRSQTTFDTRVLASNTKINNEASDSWLKFAANSYIDVDPQHGELTALVNIGNQMLFFQPKAFGSLSINDRALIQTNSISQLSLGLSGVLSRFDYGKIGMGVSHRDHVILTQNGLYWIDMVNKSMYKHTSGPEEISLMKGMSSYFKTKLSLLSNLDELFLFSDPAYREVSIVSYEDGKQFHLVYNELTDAFTSFYTYYPEFVINYNNKVLSASDNLNFYKHNDSSVNRCSFYGASAVPSNITLIVNPSSMDTILFTNLEWLTEVYNGTSNVYNETFTSLRISNDYQDTGNITLTNNQNIKRRLRRWRNTVPRAMYDETGTLQSRLDARIRDTYMKLKLEFSNASSRKFVAHDIITYFTVTNK